MMHARERLTALFEKINNAYLKAGRRKNDLVDMVTDLQTGEFFGKSRDSQISILSWYEAAYLGREELLWGLMDEGLLPKGFDNEMRVAYWSYYLTSESLSPESRAFYEAQIADHLPKCPNEGT